MSNDNSQAVKLSIITIVSLFLSSLSFGLCLSVVRRYGYREIITGGAALVTTSDTALDS